MLGPKKPIKIIPSWYTNQMMYAVDIGQPAISGCYVPPEVGLARETLINPAICAARSWWWRRRRNLDAT